MFTRVITDESYRFDEIAEATRGRCSSKSCRSRSRCASREDLSLNQLRLSVGRADLTDDEVRVFHREQPVLFERDQPVPADAARARRRVVPRPRPAGRRRRPRRLPRRDNAPLLDVTRSAAAPVDAEPFWESVRREDGDRIVLTPQRFYLLMSNEAVSIPPTLASEMTAYDPTSGELRTHYAGFFDPGFGYDPAGMFKGSRAALEVRAHDVPFMIEHGQRVCKLTFERMLEAPQRLYGQGIGSSYQRQDETLSKHFAR